MGEGGSRSLTFPYLTRAERSYLVNALVEHVDATVASKHCPLLAYLSAEVAAREPRTQQCHKNLTSDIQIRCRDLECR